MECHAVVQLMGHAVVRTCSQAFRLLDDLRLQDCTTYLNIFNTVAPISAGDSTTCIPHSLIMAILAVAVSDFPPIIAPACPILRPFGAVRPAINPTTGFDPLSLIHSAASVSIFPPISPMITIASVSLSSIISFTASRVVVPITGSPPIPIQVDCPSPSLVT